jgi:hypothetical protein
MTKFGELKTKVLVKLTESYNSGNKKELKDLIKKLKSNKDLVEVYKFYEDMETTYIQQKDNARLFVETLEPHFIQKMKTIDSDCKKLNKILKDVVIEKNELYEWLDSLSEEHNINNINDKFESKEKFIKFLTEEKENKKENTNVQIENYTLLNNILVNNFNIKYGDFLNEDQKKIFKNIVSMTEENLINEVNSLKVELNGKIENILNESNDSSLVEKLSNVKKQINETKLSRYNYFKLIELKKGLV